MGKSTRLKARVALDNDPTAERLQHDPSVAVDPLWTGGERRTTLKVRRFRTSRLDHLYALDAITWAQHYAGNWWRTHLEEGLGNGRMCADYGQSVRGSRDPSPLPISMRAERARRLLHDAKTALATADRLASEDVLSDPHPKLSGRKSKERCERWRRGLQSLAIYLKVAA